MAKWYRDSHGRFASTSQQDGKGARKSKNRRNLADRLKRSVGGGGGGRSTLRGGSTKRVVSKLERKSQGRHKRRTSGKKLKRG